MLLLVAVLLLAVALAFGRAVPQEMVAVDDSLIYDNPQVLQGPTLGNIRWAATARTGRVWNPLTWWSLQLDAGLSNLIHGSPAVPAGNMGPLPDPTVYHLDNIVLHALATVVLFLLLKRATGRMVPSFLVALIWAVHPLRVESVAWITERKDVLSGLFGFLAIYFYVVRAQKPGRIWGALVFVSMALSLMAKPTFVTLPFVLLLLDWWPLKRINGMRDLWRMALEKWPLFMLSFGRALLTSYITRKHTINGDLANSIVSYVRYLWMHVDFSGLAVFYPLQPILAWELAGAVVLLAAITALCWWRRKQQPWLIVGWLWYLGTLVPMIGLRQIFLQACADRFTYLPGVGLLMMVLFSMPVAWYSRRRGAVALLGAGTVVAAVLVVFTNVQVGYWHDTVTLMQRALAVTPRSPYVMGALGAAYLRQHRIPEAIAANEEMAALDPHSVDARASIASLYLLTEKKELAIEWAQKALEVDQNSALAHFAMGIALLGNQRYEESVRELERSAELDPASELTRMALAEARAKALHGQ